MMTREDAQAIYRAGEETVVRVLSEGTLANFKADCSRRLEPVEAAIRDLASVAPVAGFDETGVRATGSLHWLHTVSTRSLTWYYAHLPAPKRLRQAGKRRGREAIDAAGILADYRGRAIHDCWKLYFSRFLRSSRYVLSSRSDRMTYRMYTVSPSIR